MKTLIEIAQEKGALLSGKYNGQEPCIEICESELQATFDDYCKQFEPVGWWREGNDLDESDYYPSEHFPDLDTAGCIPLYTKPQPIPSEVKAYIERLEMLAKDYTKWLSKSSSAPAITLQLLAETTLKAKPDCLKD